VRKFRCNYRLNGEANNGVGDALGQAGSHSNAEEKLGGVEVSSQREQNRSHPHQHHSTDYGRLLRHTLQHISYENCRQREGNLIRR